MSLTSDQIILNEYSEVEVQSTKEVRGYIEATSIALDKGDWGEVAKKTDLIRATAIATIAMDVFANDVIDKL